RAPSPVAGRRRPPGPLRPSLLPHALAERARRRRQGHAADRRLDQSPHLLAAAALGIRGRLCRGPPLRIGALALGPPGPSPHRPPPRLEPLPSRLKSG